MHLTNSSYTFIEPLTMQPVPAQTIILLAKTVCAAK